MVWDDQGPDEELSDYGIAYLFQLYLNQHYGGAPIIQALAHNRSNGIQSINETLAQFGYKKTFADVFREFSLAALIDNPKVKKGNYYFADLDINVNPTPEPGLQYRQNGAPPWGTDYVKITSPKEIERISLNGVEFLASPWQVVADPLNPANKVLWGNKGNLTDNFMILPVDLTAKTAATMSFDTIFDIDEAWDYGFVQVSMDNGKTWTSLANPDTRTDLDPNAHPKVMANVPGFTGTSYGPDGVTPTWKTESLDLSAYAGKKILVAFRNPLNHCF